jgi:hypothetical protein
MNMNSSQQKMIVHNEIDVINARMAVRNFAGHYGFNSKDQACISLISSSLVNFLGLDQKSHSASVEMLIEYFEHDQKHGVRVTCTKNRAETNDWQIMKRLGNSHFLVDDVQLKPTRYEGIEVIVTKWDSSYKVKDNL